MQLTYMRSITFLGKFTSGSRTSASHSDLRKLRIHGITACIYKINCDNPVSRWSFQTNLKEQPKNKLVELLKVSSGLVERTKELGIFDFKIKLQYKRNVPEAEYPREGTDLRISSKLPDLFSRKKNELIGKSYLVLLLWLPT